MTNPSGTQNEATMPDEVKLPDDYEEICGNCGCYKGAHEDDDGELICPRPGTRFTLTRPNDVVDMLLFCPHCGSQHVDEPDDRSQGWTNPPHRSHLCHECGCIWRPADVPTNGVASIETKGKADTWRPEEQAMPAVTRPNAPSDVVEIIGQIIEDELFPIFGAGPYEATAAKVAAALSASGNADVPPLPRPAYCKPHEFLLLSSYCGDDNDACSERRPCADCLAMCNVFGEDGKYLRELGTPPAEGEG